MDESTNLQYVPPPQLPTDFEKRLRDITGVCPTGEPGFRFVWGCDRTKFYGGKEDQVYIDPNGRFVGLPYFVAEGWTPESVYNREEWEASRYGMLIDDYEFDSRLGRYVQKFDATIDVLGPFPEKGVWDYIRTCRREDFSPLSFDEMLDVAREWKQNSTRPKAAQRAIAEYMRFNDGIKAMKLHAFNEAKGKHREFIARELAKPDTNRANNFDTSGPAPKAKKAIAPGMIGSVGVGPNTTLTPAGLIVPSSALNN